MKNDRGYTLVEVLASITILTIVLTVFFQHFVFSQKTTTDNKEHLVTLNIAESVLERIINDEGDYDYRADFINDEDLVSPGTYDMAWCEEYNASGCSEGYRFNVNERTYSIKIIVGSEKDHMGIYKIIVEVYGSDNKLKSTVEGFAEL